MKRSLSWLLVMVFTVGCFQANNRDSDTQHSENEIPIYGVEYRDNCVMTDSNVEVTRYRPPAHDNHGLECYVNRQEQIIAEAPFSAASHMEDLGYMVCTEKEFELLAADPCMKGKSTWREPPRDHRAGRSGSLVGAPWPRRVLRGVSLTRASGAFFGREGSAPLAIVVFHLANLSQTSWFRVR